MSDIPKEIKEKADVVVGLLKEYLNMYYGSKYDNIMDSYNPETDINIFEGLYLPLGEFAIILSDDSSNILLDIDYFGVIEWDMPKSCKRINSSTLPVNSWSTPSSDMIFRVLQLREFNVGTILL